MSSDNRVILVKMPIGLIIADGFKNKAQAEKYKSDKEAQNLSAIKRWEQIQDKEGLQPSGQQLLNSLRQNTFELMSVKNYREIKTNKEASK